MSPDLICIVSKEGYFQKINPAVCQKLHYTEAELMAQPVSVLIHPDDKERTAEVRAKLLDHEPLVNFQNRYLTKEGKVVWLEWTSVYLPDREIVFAIAKDITVRKLAELELAKQASTFRELTTHFKMRNEKDRQAFAGELHEDIGQLATAIKMKLELFSSLLPIQSSQIQTMLHQLQSSTSLLVNKVRNISYTINPSDIHHLGLNASLYWLCTEFTLNTGITCTYKSKFRDEEFSDTIKIDLYRVCQEALQNIRQHAGASKAAVVLRQASKGLHLSISDDGTGIAPTKPKQSGISILEAYALSMNGKLTTKSEPTGTTVTLLVAQQPVSV